MKHSAGREGNKHCKQNKMFQNKNTKQPVTKILINWIKKMFLGKLSLVFQFSGLDLNSTN